MQNRPPDGEQQGDNQQNNNGADNRIVNRSTNTYFYFPRISDDLLFFMWWESSLNSLNRITSSSSTFNSNNSSIDNCCFFIDLIYAIVALALLTWMLICLMITIATLIASFYSLCATHITSALSDLLQDFCSNDKPLSAMFRFLGLSAGGMGAGLGGILLASLLNPATGPALLVIQALFVLALSPVGAWIGEVLAHGLSDCISTCASPLRRCGLFGSRNQGGPAAHMPAQDPPPPPYQP